MSNQKIGRNALCLCGSGKKFKNCCLKGSQKQIVDDLDRGDVVDQNIHEAAILSLEHNEKAVLEAIVRLETISSRTDLTEDQKQNALLNLAQAYQRRGEHQKAVKALNLIVVHPAPSKNQILPAMIKQSNAVSQLMLGDTKEACRLFEEALCELEKLNAPAKIIAGVYMEAGRAFHLNGESSRASECWEKTLKYSEGKDEEKEMCARAKANLGALQLSVDDEAIQLAGVKMVEESSLLKQRIGDLEGLANNHCNLGLYYFKKRRFERAIAFMRIDLQISRKVGDLRAIGTSLCNLSALYGELRQLAPARKLLAEAENIGKSLNDSQLIAKADLNRKRINEIGKIAGQKNEKIGSGADCACGSSKEYQNCCGCADVEPVDFPAQFAGVSKDLSEVVDEVTRAGGEPSVLDFIFRETAQSKQRQSWHRMHIHDGWFEIKELPDMANHHLAAARILAKESILEADSVTKPLACVILAACALEAFSNQVAYFLHNTKNYPEKKLHAVPPELAKDLMEFQRRTELTRKWDILGKALCGKLWPPPVSSWSDFQNLIHIRNELVHFKADDYEQVIPPPKQIHKILRCIPASVKLRDVARSWPIRLLTPSFAEWAVSVADTSIYHIKEGYKQTRCGKG